MADTTNALTKLAAVLKEANKNGKYLGFDEVSGEIRTIDPSLSGSDSEIEATSTATSRNIEDWVADGINVESIDELRTFPGYRSDQIAIVAGYYNDTPGIGGGLFFWNLGSTIPDDGGTYIKVTGDDTGRWQRIKGDVTKSEDYGLFNGAESQTGVVDVIDGMRRATPDGGTIKFYPVPNTIVTETVRVEDKSINFDLGGNTFAHPDNGQVFELVSNITVQQSVDSVALVGFDTLGFDNNGDRQVTQLFMNDPTVFSVGDTVKVVSTDELPDLFQPNRRCGEFATIAQVNDNNVVLYSKLFDHNYFESDILVGKVPDVTGSVYNGKFTGTDGVEWPDNTSRIYMEMLKSPKVENIEGINLAERLASFYSCYEFIAHDIHVRNSGNYPVGQGYVLNDVGSYGGFATNISSEHARHVVTTNSRPSTDINDFNVGRGMHLTVVGGVGKFSNNHAFDCHPESAYTTYIGCHAYQCRSGFQTRAPYTSFIDCDVLECANAFQFQTADENYANSFRGGSVRGCRVICTTQGVGIFESFINVGGGYVNGTEYGPITVENTYVQFVNYDNPKNILLDGNVPNLTAHFNHNTFVFSDAVSDKLFKIILDNHSYLYADGNTFNITGANSNDLRIVQFTGTYPQDTTDDQGLPVVVDKPTVWFTNNTISGDTPIDAVVASSDAYLFGNSIQTTTAGFEARKFDGELLTFSYTD